MQPIRASFSPSGLMLKPLNPSSYDRPNTLFRPKESKALAFYTKILGFKKKNDVPVRAFRRLAVTGKDDPSGTELSLEPSDHHAITVYKAALKTDGIPAKSFQVDNLNAKYERLKSAGVAFMMKPSQAGDVKTAMLDDTCGNLIQLIETRHTSTSSDKAEASAFTWLQEKL